MSATLEESRVLIATDNASDAEQLTRLIKEHFHNVHVSDGGATAAGDFEAQKPDVLVLAFDSIAKAQAYYLGLYRSIPALDQHPHRTVLLCSKDELTAAFGLCKKQYFDDYVLFWPLVYDGLRLPMSIWNAAREMSAAQPEVPRRADLLAHSRHLQDLERTVQSELSVAEQQIADAHRSMNDLESALANASEDFSRRLMEEGAGGIEIKDSEALAREIARLKTQQLAEAQVARAKGLEPMNNWTRQFKDRVTPSLEAARPFVESVRALRPRLLVVDDDRMIRTTLAAALDAQRYEITFAGDSIEALRLLRREPPDLILMDCRMPGLDGITLTRRLKASPDLASVPIIMMTGDSRRETVQSSIEAGAADFVVKPFTRQGLQAKLEKVLPPS